MDKIPFKRFKELEIKTGKIKKVEEVENADKLYKIKIDIGEEKRTTVAGLKKHYSPEELKNKEVAVVTNLEPTEIMGVKSEAMILAAVQEEEDKVALLKPDKEIKPGTPVE